MISKHSIAVSRKNPARLPAKERLAGLLIVGMFFLRSLLAPGLVMEVRSGLTIVYCDALIESITPDHGFETANHQHASHVYHVPVPWAQETPGSEDPDHDHGPGDQVYDLHCGLWTASGTLLAGTPSHISNGFTYITPDLPIEAIVTFAVHKSLYGQRHPRAPPLHLVA
jgi:hypothetical protein